MNNEAVAKLKTRMGDVAPTDADVGPTVAVLGGTRIYGPDQITLEKGLRNLCQTILSNASRHSCIDTNYLLGLCRQELSVPLSRQIFRACLSGESRLGNIERPLCRSLSGASFRIVVSASRLHEFRSQLTAVIELARGCTEIKVRTVQDRFYPGREKGTWFIAQHLLQRLAYLGFVTQADKWNFRVPKVLLNAQAKIDGGFVTPDPSRLA